MKPALTAEEWDDVRKAERGDYNRAPLNFSISRITPNPHGLAALCLYGQPFGFTQKDLRRLREIGRVLERENYSRLWLDIQEFADRIEALLPPEESK